MKYLVVKFKFVYVLLIVHTFIIFNAFLKISHVCNVMLVSNVYMLKVYKVLFFSDTPIICFKKITIVCSYGNDDILNESEKMCHKLIVLGVKKKSEIVFPQIRKIQVFNQTVHP